MGSLQVNQNIINDSVRQILTTIDHKPIHSNIEDDKYLLDFDLEVLGRDWKSYEKYANQIREEYSNYSDNEYKVGRVQILENFLNRPSLFYTHEYRNTHEIYARGNIAREIQILLMK